MEDQIKITSEGFKVYKELRDEALKSIVDSIALNDNRLDGIAVLVYNSENSALANPKVVVKFKLNGEDFEVEHQFMERVPAMTRAQHDIDLMNILLTKIANAIAVKIIKENYEFLAQQIGI